MKINRVGVDLAKNVFQLHGADRKGKTVWTRKLSRGKWLSVLFDTVQPGTEIGVSGMRRIAEYLGDQLAEVAENGVNRRRIATS